MKLNNILAAVAVLAGSAAATSQCAGKSSGALNAAGSAVSAFQADTSDNCLCASGYYWDGSACSAVTGTGSCTVGTPADTSALMTMSQVTSGVDMDGTSDQVPFKLQLPMYAHRAFTSMGAAALNDDSPNAGCDAASLFLNFGATHPAAVSSGACVDEWAFKVHFKNLIACGFAQDNTASIQQTGYTTYTGNFVLQYTEKITIGQADTASFQTGADRTVTAIFPVAVLLKSTYVAPMSVSNLKVYTNLDVVNWAIVGQYIPKGGVSAPAPTANIKFTVQKPYDVSSYGTITTTDAITVTSIAGPTRCAADGSGYTGNSGVTCTGGGSSGDQIIFNAARSSAATCKFTNYAYTLPYTVNCYSSIEGTVDCPLAADDTSNSVTFTITSENFCVDQAQKDLINGVITITNFDSVSVADHSVTQNAWQWGTHAFFRMEFSGLNVSTVTMKKIESDYGTSLAGSYSNAFTSFGSLGFVDSGAATLLTSTGPTSNQPGTLDSYWTTPGLGLNQGTQKYYFQVTVDDNLLVGGSVPTRGTSKFLKLQVTIDVTYNTVYRRRRRQAAASGEGAKESATQTISAPDTQEAAVSPANSAVRAAPAVAFVLALLSAAALL